MELWLMELLLPPEFVAESVHLYVIGKITYPTLKKLTRYEVARRINFLVEKYGNSR